MGLLRPTLYALGLAGMWVVLALLNEGTTYHLAPLLIALVVPVGAALADASSPPARLVAAATLGAVVALSGTTILTLAERLQGASLLPFGGAVTEAIIFALAGSVIGWVLASVRNGNR